MACDIHFWFGSVYSLQKADFQHIIINDLKYDNESSSPTEGSISNIFHRNLRAGIKSGWPTSFLIYIHRIIVSPCRALPGYASSHPKECTCHRMRTRLSKKHYVRCACPTPIDVFQCVRSSQAAYSAFSISIQAPEDSN